MAAAAFLSAAYLIWASERKVVVELREKIRPKLKCSFDMKDAGCVRPNTKFSRRRPAFALPASDNTITRNWTYDVSALSDQGTIGPTAGVWKIGMEDETSPLTATYYRLKVECDGFYRVSDCVGRIEWIKKGENLIDNWEPVQLPFAPAERPEAISKQIRNGSPEFLDFMFITETNLAQLVTYRFVGSSSVDWREILAKPDLYTLRINILSNTPTIAVDVFFKWTGDRSTSEITCREIIL
jgi:hypothetical protein